MKKSIMLKSVVFVGITLLTLNSCGGGGSETINRVGVNSAANNSNNNPTKNNNNIQSISQYFKIDITKVKGYSSDDSINDQYLSVLNYLRSLKIKCNDSFALSGPVSPMVWNQLLADAAEEHDDDMRLSEYYGHDGSGTVNDITGQTNSPARASEFFERIHRTGFDGQATAENIARVITSPTPAASNTWITIMEEWMKSTHGHCSNIMNPSLTKFGMHESNPILGSDNAYRVYWSQEFGS